VRCQRWVERAHNEVGVRARLRPGPLGRGQPASGFRQVHERHAARVGGVLKLDGAQGHPAPQAAALRHFPPGDDPPRHALLLSTASVAFSTVTVKVTPLIGGADCTASGCVTACLATRSHAWPRSSAQCRPRPARRTLAAQWRRAARACLRSALARVQR
jgi:hypothetical protein